jgi:chemotaxis protein methyltransferase CheR
MAFEKKEIELVYEMARRLIGSSQNEELRHDVLVANVERRVQALKMKSLMDYLKFVIHNRQELAQLVSGLTIHTTSWFREIPHFTAFKEWINTSTPTTRKKTFRVLSAGCSSGQELYSFGLMLEAHRMSHPDFRYELVGFDIDPVSLERARKAIYPMQQLEEIPAEFQTFLMKGTEKSKGFFTLDRNIRTSSQFYQTSLLKFKETERNFDLVVCRNVLIYFSREDVEQIVQKLSRAISDEGRLYLGHNENVPAKKIGLKALGGSIYARDADAMRANESDVARANASLSVKTDAHSVHPARPQLIVLGASTGGTQALTELLRELPAQMPPICVVQHITPGFARTFAERLEHVSGLKVPKPESGMALKEGHIYIAQGDYHILVEKRAGSLRLATMDSEPVNRHRPSVDVLFESVAKSQVQGVMGILLTGMGKDGAQGLLKLRSNGAFTMAQDQHSSVVFGMPKEAIQLGGAVFVGNLKDLRKVLIASIGVPMDAKAC